MRYVAPSARLAPFVRSFVIVEVDAETTRVRMPDAHVVLGVRYRGAASVVRDHRSERVPDLSLAGLAAHARTMRTSADGAVVLASFHPGAAARFFDVPMDELRDATLDVRDLLPAPATRELAERVATARDDAQRVSSLERFLLARVDRRAEDALVRAALRMIDDARGAVRIDALARALHTSVDPLEKRLRRVVGASPKAYASLVRLDHAIALHRAGATLAQSALVAGFSDQAHFTRAFRAAVGDAPSRVLRARAPER